ncbi:hypothetical protein DFH06DRAFT_1329965 [Mycena polygramma]|nr:hypothetical protein DFH06DRAFT_1329965 [Mycena polygramma]
MPAVTTPNWPARLDTLDSLLDFIDNISTPSLAFSELNLDFYPPVHGSYVGDESAYTDIDGKPYDFYVYGKASSPVAYGEHGRHVTVISPGAEFPRAERIFDAQLRTLAAPVKLDDDLDYDENREITVTPASDTERYTMVGGTYIDLKLSRGCILWEAGVEGGPLRNSVPLDPRYFGVKEGTWILAFGTFHRIESLAFEYRYYQFSIGDLRVLDFAPEDLPSDTEVAAAETGDLGVLDFAPEDLPSDTEVAAAETTADDVAAGAAATSVPITGADENNSVDVQDNALSESSTLSDASTSDPIVLPAKRRSSRKAAGSGGANKRSKTSGKDDQGLDRQLRIRGHALSKEAHDDPPPALPAMNNESKTLGAVDHVQGMLFAAGAPTFQWVSVAITCDRTIATLGNVVYDQWISYGVPEGHRRIDFERCSTRVSYLPDRRRLPLENDFCMLFAEQEGHDGGALPYDLPLNGQINDILHEDNVGWRGNVLVLKHRSSLLGFEDLTALDINKVRFVVKWVLEYPSAK